MSIKKNTSGQSLLLFAFTDTDGKPKTGDAANITVKIRKDYGALAATTTANPTELESGYYSIPLTQAESNCDILDVIAVSATADIQVVGVPGRTFPVSPNRSTFWDNNDNHASSRYLEETALEASVQSVLTTGGTGPWTGADVSSLALETSVQSVLTTGGPGPWTTGGGGSAPTAAEVADEVWNRASSGHTTPGTFGYFVDAQITSRSSHDPAAAADAVWDELQAEHVGAGSFGQYLDDKVSTTSKHDADAVWAVAARTLTSFGFTNEIVQAVWDEPQAGHVTADTFGAYLDAAVSSVQTGGLTLTAIGNEVWNRSQSLHTTPGSFGYYLDSRVSQAASTGATAQEVWEYATRELTAFAYTSEIVDGVWDEAQADHQTAGTFGKFLDKESSATYNVVMPLAADWADGGRLDVILDAINDAVTSTGVAISQADKESIANTLLDLANGVETNRTLREALRLILSSANGKLSGAATDTMRFRDTNDMKDRMVVTTDADGNRLSITYDDT